MSRRFGELRSKMGPERNRSDLAKVAEAIDSRVRAAEFAHGVWGLEYDLYVESGGADPIMAFYLFLEWAGL